jgi:hypothetical protein
MGVNGNGAGFAGWYRFISVERPIPRPSPLPQGKGLYAILPAAACGFLFFAADPPACRRDITTCEFTKSPAAGA